MNVYEIKMILKIRHIESKSVVRTSDIEMVEYIDATDLELAFNMALKVKAWITKSVAETYNDDEVSSTLDAVVRYMSK